MRVVFLPEVREYFKTLAEILFDNEYFGFEESAIAYVRELISDIEENLPIKNHKEAPSHFDLYGKNMMYATFAKSKRTTWYVFFTVYYDIDEIVYLVRYISNNHVSGQYLG